MISPGGESLSDMLSRLRAQPDPQLRGRAFESFIAELLGRSHFRVTPNATAGQRQIDMHADRGRLRLLLEAKWTKTAASQASLDGLEARLRRASVDTIGVLVSMSGFSKPLISRIERETRHPVLLLDGLDIQAASDAGTVYELLTWKLEQLVRYRRVAFGSPTSSPLWLPSLPESSVRLISSDGETLPYWESGGDFSSIAPTLSVSDPAWARRGAVSFGLSPDVRTGPELVELLTRLAQLGFVSGEGFWRLEQQSVVWSGVGTGEFGRQIEGWARRMGGRQLHHSEKVIYTEDFRDGRLVLVADIAAADSRSVRWCELTFMLPGIPLDMTPYENLRAEVAAGTYPAFEVLDHDPAKRAQFRHRRAPLEIHPKAYLVRDDLRGNHGEPPWVVGVVIDDPLPLSARWSTELGAPREPLGDVLVSMGQHYRWGDDVRHQLHRAVVMRISEVQTIHLHGDWSPAEPLPNAALPYRGDRIWPV